MADIPSQIGKYPVLRLLGQGAMGKVYLGEDPFIGRQVAIKVLSSEGDAEAHRRFLEEARTVGQLSHPNIVTLLEFGFHEGSPFLVMELLKGESLESWLARPHPLPELLRVLRDLCQAVAHAHLHEVLHRDIKPSNAQVLHDGSCKLMDFGIARSQRMKLTATGMVVGTPQFIAPEVLRDAAYTPASDTYAVGLVAYQALAGHNPFAAGNLEACLTKVLTLTPPPLSSLRGDLSAELAELIDHCLAKDPELRPKIGRLLQSLERALAAGSPGASGWIADTAVATYALPRTAGMAAVPAPASPAKAKAPHGKLVAAGIGALLVAAAGVGLFLDRRPAPAPVATTADAPGELPGSDLAAPPTASPAPKEIPAAPPLVQPAAENPKTSPAEPGTKAQPQPAEKSPATPPPLADPPPATSSPARTEPPATAPAPVLSAATDPPAAPSAGTGKDEGKTELPATAPAAAPATVQPPAAEPPAPVSATPAPVLRSLSPTLVRRGSSASLEILGEGLGPTSRVQISRGRSDATGIEIRKTRLAGDGRLVLTLFIDSSVPLGPFTVRIVDAEGRLSNGLSLEVGL